MSKKALEFASVKQISFVPGIVFIDETIVSPTFSTTNKKHQVHEILTRLKSIGYPVFISSIEMVYRLHEEKFYWSCSDYDSYEDFPFSHDAQMQLKNCLSEMSLSAKLDFVKHLRSLLLTEIASHAHYNYVFVGDSASTLSCDLLSNIALGRGSQVPFDTNFYDSRFKVPICRPIREFLNKEILLYNHFHSCDYSILPDMLTKTDDKSSVQRLTETFIFNLQEEFPATVFTIFRTGGKLSKNESAIQNETCILCMSKLDNTRPEACSALEALSLSEKLSQVLSHPSQIAHDENAQLQMDHNDEGYLVKCEIGMDIFQYLCHGCSIPFRHMKNQINYFPLLLKMESVKIERQQMKNMIKDFLIEDSKPS